MGRVDGGGGRRLTGRIRWRPMSTPKRSIITTAAGSNAGAYGPAEWGMLGWTTFMWGSSFLWIAIGLDGFTPGMVAFLRLALGAAALAILPAARRRINREDWPAVAIVSVAGNAGPALLFAVAEQTVESSVAGMINAAVPLATAAIAFMLGQRSLRPVHIVGIIGGLGGVLLLSVPTISGADPAVAGMMLLFLAVIGYAISNNVLVPLQQRYGGIPVIMQAQLLGIVVLAPWGLWDLGANDPSLGPILAVVILGVLGTGVSRAVHATLVGRVGAPRASIVGYLIPGVAIVLGVVFRSETISPVELVGLGVVLVSAFLVTRAVR